MAESITGPGIGGAGGGPSEIAALSVGVYVVDQTGAGFARVKAEAATQGTQIGATAGTNVASEFDKKGIGTEGGATGMLGGLHRARRAFHHAILGLFAVPFVATEAFKVGTKIGEFLFGDHSEAKKDSDAIEKRSDDMLKIIEKSREKLTEEASKATPDKPEMSPALKQLRERRASMEKFVKEDEQKLKDLQERIKNEVRDPRGKEFEREKIETNITAYENEDRDLLAIQKDLNAEKGQLLLIDKEEADLIARMKADTLAMSRAKADLLAMERRVSATRGVEAERMAVDISRIRQVLTLGVNQRFPPMPASEVTRYGVVR